MPNATLGIIASAKQNTGTVASRGSGTPADNGVAAWATKTNAVDGAVGTNPATYATWTNSTSGAVGFIEVSGYDFSSIPVGATGITITAKHRGLVNNTGRVTSQSMQVMDGATNIGSATAITAATAAADTTSPSLSVTRAQLVSATFKVRVTVTHAGNTQSLVYSLDHIDVTATYSP